MEKTAIAKIAQGSSEVSNAIFSGHAYSPYTADNAAHRAISKQPGSQPGHGALTPIHTPSRIFEP